MAPAKYLQVKDAISKQIRNGDLQPGEKLSPSRVLMEEHNVSYATISKVLDKLGGTGLIEKKWGKGVYVSENINAIDMVNIVVTFDSTYQMTHPYMSAIIRGIGQAVEGLNYNLQFFPLLDSCFSAKDFFLTKMIKEGQVHGVIACSVHPPRDIDFLENEGIPVVSISGEYPHTLAGCVLKDSKSAAKQIVDYLVGLGHTKINFVTGPDYTYSARIIRDSMALKSALVEEMAARSIPLRPQSIIHSDYQWENVEPGIRKWLTSNKRPTAIIFVDDLAAIETMKVASELGIEVPRDISIIGSGSMMHESTLTCVSASLNDMGLKAVEMLTARINGDTYPDNKCILPIELILRGSSGAVPLSGN